MVCLITSRKFCKQECILLLAKQSCPSSGCDMLMAFILLVQNLLVTCSRDRQLFTYFPSSRFLISSWSFLTHRGVVLSCCCCCCFNLYSARVKVLAVQSQWPELVCCSTLTRKEFHKIVFWPIICLLQYHGTYACIHNGCTSSHTMIMMMMMIIQNLKQKNHCVLGSLLP